MRAEGWLVLEAAIDSFIIKLSLERLRLRAIPQRKFRQGR
jgi:hypothetical protein